MAEVSFYVLPTDRDSARLGLLLKLIEKAYAAKEPTYIYHEDFNTLRQIDRTIWGISATSFIPHQLIREEEDITSEDFIYLGAQGWSLPQYSLLINLGVQIPENIDSFRRIFEIITTNPANIEQSRDRYRFYRGRGDQIQTHKL